MFNFTGTGTETKTAFLEWFSDYKNGPPFLSFGGFQKRSAIFLVWNEEPEKKKTFLLLFLTSLLEGPNAVFTFLLRMWR